MINRDEQLFNEVCMPIYRELFKKATPSADFDELIKTGETKKDGFFNDYYLLDNITKDIIDKHTKNNTKRLRIRKYEKSKIRTTILLGCSPTGNKSRSKI